MDARFPKLWPLILLSVFLLALPVPAEAVRLVFTGDIMVHKTQLAAARLRGTKTYDFDYQFRLAAPFLQGDAVIGHLETVLAGPERGYTGYPAFNSPDSLAASLRRAGFDTLMLANNHTFDRASSGSRRTVSFLREHGFHLAGLSITPPLLLELDGIRVGIVNAAYGSNGPLPKAADAVRMNIIGRELLISSVRELRMMGADCVVACLHWGEEYKSKPGAVQKKQAAWCFEAGADMVVGTHPHVLQPVEFRSDGRLVFWSLGNFVSGQRTLPRERTVIAAVDIELDQEGLCRIAQVGVLPAAVLKRPVKGRDAAHGFVVVPAGTEQTLPADAAKRASAVHRDVLGFLGLSGAPRPDGFWPVPQVSSMSACPTSAR